MVSPSLVRVLEGIFRCGVTGAEVGRLIETLGLLIPTLLKIVSTIVVTASARELRSKSVLAFLVAEAFA